MTIPLSHSTSKTAVLLVNLGTPDAPTPFAVARFLNRFLSDPRVVHLPRWLWKIILYTLVLPFRSFRVAKLYQKIWMKEGSPLKVYTDKLEKALASLLFQSYPIPIPVYSAMTYSNLPLSHILKEIHQHAIQQLIILPLFPQFSQTTTGAVWDAVAQYFKKENRIPTVHFIHAYSGHVLYRDALSEMILQYWSKQPRSERLLFSFHGIPKAYEKNGDTYCKECIALVGEIAQRLNLPEYSYAFSFQSRFGFNEWVGPSTEQVLIEWARSGIQSVDVIAPSFSVDCLETLEELNIQMRGVFLKAGGKTYHYIPALNDHPKHVAALKGIIDKFF